MLGRKKIFIEKGTGWNPEPGGGGLGEFLVLVLVFPGGEDLTPSGGEGLRSPLKYSEEY